MNNRNEINVVSILNTLYGNKMGKNECIFTYQYLMNNDINAINGLIDTIKQLSMRGNTDLVCSTIDILVYYIPNLADHIQKLAKDTIKDKNIDLAYALIKYADKTDSKNLLI